MICGARNRAGGRCKRLSVVGKRRCKLHGGMSTGAKVFRARPGLRAANAAWVAREHAAGRKARQGFAVTPLRAIKARASETDRDRWLRMSDELGDMLPAPPGNRPVSEWSAADLLADTARLGLLVAREAIARGIDPDDPKMSRLAVEAGLRVATLYSNVQIAGLQARREDGIDRLKAAVEAFKAQEKAKGGGGGSGSGSPAAASSP